MVKNQSQNNMTENKQHWLFFYGDGNNHDVNFARLPDPPPWREFKKIEESNQKIKDMAKERNRQREIDELNKKLRMERGM